MIEDSLVETGGNGRVVESPSSRVRTVNAVMEYETGEADSARSPLQGGLF